MPARAGTAFIEVRGDFSPFDKQVGRLAVTSRSRFARIGKVAAAGVAAGFAGGAVVVRKAMAEWVEAEKVSRQTAAALKSTGGQANVTAGQIERLATAISRKAGIDDEAIQSAENLLLTFTKVRNETGQGNKIFGQATKAIVDMSAAMDQDLKSSTIQVGKALNDPIKGMTALQRVGVAFTQQQKDRVAGWVEEGNVLRAQKFILKELRTEFGGSAAAQATGFDRAKVAIDNMAESLGGFLGPKLEQAANQVARFVNEMQTGTGAGGQFARTMSGVGQAIATGFNAAKGAVSSAVGAIRGFLNRHRADVEAVRKAVQNIGQAMAAVWEKWLLPVLKRVWPGVRQILQGMARTLGGVVKVVSGLLSGDWGRAWSGAKQIVSGAVKTIGGFVRGLTAPIREAVSKVPGLFGRAFEGAKNVARGALDGVIGRIKDLGGLVKPVLRPVVAVFEAIRDAIRAVVKSAEKAISALKDVGDAVPSAPDITPWSGLAPWRRGGQVGATAVPAMLSPGEVAITPTGGAFKVPGPRVAADTVPAALPAGTAVLTESGQRIARQTGSIGEALRRQAPHFREGGVARFQRGGSAGWSRTPINVATDAARRAGGLKGRTLVNMVAIAGRESGWNPRAQNLKYPDHSIGLWQINQLAHKGRFGTDQQLMDPYVNAKAMGSLFRDSGYSPWVGVSYGNATQYLDEARRAVLATKGRAAGAGGGGGSRSFTRTTPAPITFPLLGDMLDPLVDDALLGGIQAGYDRTGARGRRQLLTQVLEGIVPESGDRATRERVDVDIPGAKGRGRGVSAGDAPRIVGWMARRAQAIDSKGYPYSSPGNRSFGIGGPMDCSGAVSKVIGPNLLPSVQASPYFLSWGEPGEGKYVTTYSRGGYGASGHVFMKLGNRFFGTSGENPGGGAGWFSGGGAGYQSSFTKRHPKGLRKGGIVGGKKLQELVKRLPKKWRRPEVIAEIQRHGVMPGLRRGGVVGPNFDFEQWLRQLRKRKRKPTLGQLVSILGADQLGSRNADLTSRTLADRVAGRSMGSLVGAQRRIKRQIRRMAREGFTGPERIRTRRLRGGLSLLQDEMGRPIGRQLGASDRLQERLARQESTLQDRLIVSGVDPESVEGLTAQRTETVSALGALQVRRAGLAKALRRAKRTGNRQAVEQVQTEIREVDDQILGLKSSIEQLNKSILEAAPTATDFANRDLALAQLTETLDDDRAALQNLEAIANQQLQAALQTADPRDDIEAANNLKSIRDQLESLNASIQEQNSQIADLLRQQNEIEKQKLALAQTQGPQLFAAMMMIWNGGIGGRAGAGRSFPSFAGLGGVART